MAIRQIIQLVSAALALAGALLAVPHSASAASASGTASAVIHNAVTVRSASLSDVPLVQVTRIDAPRLRTTERPCRPNDPASGQCRMILVELQ